MFLLSTPTFQAPPPAGDRGLSSFGGGADPESVREKLRRTPYFIPKFIYIDLMNEAAIRPRLKFVSDLPQEDIRSRVKEGLKDPELNTYELQYRTTHGQMLISFPEKHRHFWSPTMDLNLEKTDTGKTMIRVLMGPEASIWTLFMFFYTVGGLAILGGLVLGYSQYVLDKGATWLFLIPGGIAIILFFYLAALTGKTKANGQMHIMLNFLLNTVGKGALEEYVPQPTDLV